MVLKTAICMGFSSVGVGKTLTLSLLEGARSLSTWCLRLGHLILRLGGRILMGILVVLWLALFRRLLQWL